MLHAYVPMKEVKASDATRLPYLLTRPRA